MTRLRAVILASITLAVLALVPAGTARAVSRVPEGSASGGQGLTVDVWINKEEGGIYRPGESMRVFFRSSVDAHVLVYNIDTEGYIHLVYPYGAADPMRVEGGRTYNIPARHDPYDLVADGPPGMEFVVAVASRYPFRDLPWYLTGGAPGSEPIGRDEDDELESGVIVGDPYVGMERLNRRILPSQGEGDSDANETYFYIERRVEYPRYVCADCHYSAFGFDPYLSVCSVIDIRIDATWVRYAPVRVRTARPRYYYWIRPNAPNRYREWKQRWSSIDGGATLRSRFVVERSQRSVRSRDMRNRREQPEFRDLRRNRPGRLWQGRDEVLKLWEKEKREGRGKTPANVAPRPGKERDRIERPRNEDRGRDQDRGKLQERDKGQNRDRGQDRDKGRDRGRERDRPQERDKGQDREDFQDRDRGQDRGGERDRPQERDKGKDRDKGQERERGQDRDKGHDRDKGQDRGDDRRDQGDSPKNQGEWRYRGR
jgi:hypothetical protein